MAKQSFETIEKKRGLFAQRVLTLVLVFVGLFTLTYIVGLAATRHNARALVEPTEAAAEEKGKQGKEKKGDETQTDEGGEAQTDAQPVESNGRTIYLTFDDGPGPYTEKLLDILKEHDVKATFFVTHAIPKLESVIKREYKEGHSVGVHSYSHNYEKIYVSSEAFWEDFNAMQEVIVNQTGEETKLLRFPGGSSNTISEKTTKGIMTQLVKEAGEKGLSYFDWNVASGDAAKNISGSEVLQNCKVGAANHKNALILCHDVKEYTVNVMDEFITWAKENGYTFAALTPESDGAHHLVKN